MIERYTTPEMARIWSEESKFRAWLVVEIAVCEVLADRGVILAACPGCLQAAGKTEADLQDGVTVANKTEFFSFTEGRILTLDY